MNHPRAAALREMSFLLEERRRLATRARKALRSDDLVEALYSIVNYMDREVETDQRYVELHRECLAMIEHASKVLELHHALRPIAPIVIENPASPKQEAEHGSKREGRGDGT